MIDALFVGTEAMELGHNCSIVWKCVILEELIQRSKARRSILLPSFSLINSGLACNHIFSAALRLNFRPTLIISPSRTSCGYCCNWEWGLTLPGSLYLGFSPSWLPVHLRRRKKGYIEKQLPLFARYWTATSLAGSPYYGLTSVGNVPAQARPPILSKLSLMHYRKLPGRLLLPWRIFPRHGTIAADTDFYPFGTRMFIPGYGWGEVEDRGSAIKGPAKIDLYHRSHTEALKWGRKKLQVLVVLPGQGAIDSLKIPRPIKDVLKGLDWLRSLII